MRPYRPSDLPNLYRICLQTGANGKDATALYRDPQLLGHYYAAPYAILEPELCLIAPTEEDEPAGYILGSADSETFSQRCETEWFPALRKRYPMPADDDHSPDAVMIRNLHAGYRPPFEAKGFPAHLHIDLLPSLQGRGMGKQLMNAFLDLLRQRGVPGVHLGVSAANTQGIAFYERFGFTRLHAYPAWSLYGLKLSA